jgi:bifunctional polynucleotide phosphatase/kinase
MKWRYELVCGAVKGHKDSEIGYLYGCSDSFNDQSVDKIKTCQDNPTKNELSLACFDLDQTLINTKSGEKFPISSSDWIWCYDNVRETLQKYSKRKYRIIIITNQAGIKDSESKMKQFKEKIEFIEEDLKVFDSSIQFELLCAPHKDVHRKPFPTLLEKVDFDRESSFFCGDGAGRPKDHTSADIKFAYNLRLRFRTPECEFLGETDSVGFRSYPIEPFEDVIRLSSTKRYQYQINDQDKPELILMVGLPASGKSYLAKEIDTSFQLSGKEVSIISLDEIKSKHKMLKTIEDCARDAKSIIIDNTNLDVQTRSDLIKSVKSVDPEYFVKIILVATPIDRCIHNNFYRYYKNYKTNPKLIPEVVYKVMNAKFVVPTKEENNEIDEIETVESGIPLELSYGFYYY